jgi:hypothetical protein
MVGPEKSAWLDLGVKSWREKGCSIAKEKEDDINRRRL